MKAVFEETLILLGFEAGDISRAGLLLTTVDRVGLG